MRASLDGALGDLLRAAVDNPGEPDAASCTRINAVFDRQMAPHRHLAWALAEAEALKRRLKAGLFEHTSDAVGEVDSMRDPDLGEAQL